MVTWESYSFLMDLELDPVAQLAAYRLRLQLSSGEWWEVTSREPFGLSRLRSEASGSCARLIGTIVDSSHVLEPENWVNVNEYP